MGLYFKVNFLQVLFSVAKVLCGGPSGAQCNFMGCFLFPLCLCAHLTALCWQPSAPILGAHLDFLHWPAMISFVLLPWLLCNQPGSLFSFISMSHLIITVNDNVQLQFSPVLAAASWDLAPSSLVSAPCRWWSHEEMSCYSWSCTTLKS